MGHCGNQNLNTFPIELWELLIFLSLKFLFPLIAVTGTFLFLQQKLFFCVTNGGTDMDNTVTWLHTHPFKISPTGLFTLLAYITFIIVETNVALAV